MLEEIQQKFVRRHCRFLVFACMIRILSGIKLFFGRICCLVWSRDCKNLLWLWGVGWKFCQECKAWRGMLNSYTEWWNFQFAPNNHCGFFFLHTFLSKITFKLNYALFYQFYTKMSTFSAKKRSVFGTCMRHLCRNIWWHLDVMDWSVLALVSHAEIPVALARINSVNIRLRYLSLNTIIDSISHPLLVEYCLESRKKSPTLTPWCLVSYTR